jgi:hypothetical protein
MKMTGPARCNGADGDDGCGARIVFVIMTATGKRVPVDPIPVPDGNVCARRIGNNMHGYVISKDHPPSPAFTRFAAHFGTCDSRPRAEPKPTPAPPPALFDLP